MINYYDELEQFRDEMQCSQCLNEFRIQKEIPPELFSEICYCKNKCNIIEAFLSS
jgi:hypothetical protein